MNSREIVEQLLSEDPERCGVRERTAFDELARPGGELILFGAGGLGKKLLRALRQDGIEPVAFIDNKLANQVIEGVPVMTPAKAAERWGSTATFVVSIWAAWADTMLEQVQLLHDLGCETVVSFIPLLWKYSALLPHVQIDLPSRVCEQKDQVLRAFDLWSDNASREEFLSQLRWRLFGDFSALHVPIASQYWQGDLIRPDDQAVYVDAGACDGDTLEQFVSFVGGHFRAAYLFEPDHRNFRALQGRLDSMPEATRRRIQAFPWAVAEADYDVAFSGGAGASSAAGAGSGTVHCTSVDHTVPEPPSLIKYDIEGFELLALQGSRRTIEEHAPALIVCAYHTQSHLWEIPLLIDSIRKGYRFYLRPHGQIWETVCYAIPA
jgi:FkbM family methyltransferase